MNGVHVLAAAWWWGVDPKRQRPAKWGRWLGSRSVSISPLGAGSSLVAGSQSCRSRWVPMHHLQRATAHPRRSCDSGGPAELKAWATPWHQSSLLLAEAGIRLGEDEVTTLNGQLDLAGAMGLTSL